MPHSLAPTLEPPNYRRLDPRDPDDLALFYQAWRWNDAMPRWYRADYETTPWDETLEYIKSPAYAGFAVLDGAEAVSLIGLRLEPSSLFCEVHLMSRRGVGADAIHRAAADIRDKYFRDRGGLGFFAWVSARNRPVRALLQRLGFSATDETKDNQRLWRLTRDEWRNEQHDQNEPTEHLRLYDAALVGGLPEFRELAA